MPSASAAWRAAISSALTSRGSAPNLDARLSLAWSELTRMRTSRLRSLAATPSLDGRADDLLQLLDRVEAEGLHAMLEISFGDRFLGLHRVHEAQHRLRERLVDQADLADRRDVIVGDARVPQDLEQVGRRVRLDRIERAAGELLDEETGGATCGVRTQQRDRLNRSELGDSRQPPGCRSGRPLAPARDDACATQGTSNGYVRHKAALRLEVPWGSGSAIYVRGSPL